MTEDVKKLGAVPFSRKNCITSIVYDYHDCGDASDGTITISFDFGPDLIVLYNDVSNACSGSRTQTSKRNKLRAYFNSKLASIYKITVDWEESDPGPDVTFTLKKTEYESYRS